MLALLGHDFVGADPVVQCGFSDDEGDLAAGFVEDCCASHACCDHAVDFVIGGAVVLWSTGQVEEVPCVRRSLQQPVHDVGLEAVDDRSGVFDCRVGVLLPVGATFGVVGVAQGFVFMMARP